MLTGTPPDSIAAIRPDTIVSRFINRASSDPERVAYSMYPMGGRQALSSLRWGDWITNARACSGAFLAQHAEAGERVAIFSDNRDLWPVGVMGAAMCGMVTVAIPPDGSSDFVAAQLADCEPGYVIVDTIARFKTLRAATGQLSRRMIIICDDLEPLRTSVAEGIYEWETWRRYGAKALGDDMPLRDELTERLDGLRPEHAASITYAPGTSSGVVRTFATRLADSEALSQVLGVTYADRLMCAESVSQPFHALLGIDVTIVTGATVGLAESRSDAFRAARNFDATILPASGNAVSQLGEALITAHSTGGYLRDAICELVGRHCRLVVTADEVRGVAFQSNLLAAGVAFATVYGTDWQTCICVNGPANFSAGSIGRAFPDVPLRLGDHAELQVCHSAHTASGYYNSKNEAGPAFSPDDLWHNTGARVERAMTGSFRIVGQMKDLLEFATGRQVAPESIETSLTALPLVAHAMCEADGANSLVAVLSLDRRRVEEWAFTRGVVAPWEALVEHPLVYEELARGVAHVNAQQDTGERITAFAPTDLEFSVLSGELDQTGAIVRPVVAGRFRHVLTELHQTRPA